MDGSGAVDAAELRTLLTRSTGVTPSDAEARTAACVRARALRSFVRRVVVRNGSIVGASERLGFETPKDEGALGVAA